MNLQINRPDMTEPDDTVIRQDSKCGPSVPKQSLLKRAQNTGSSMMHSQLTSNQVDNGCHVIFLAIQIFTIQLTWTSHFLLVFQTEDLLQWTGPIWLNTIWLWLMMVFLYMVHLHLYYICLNNNYISFSLLKIITVIWSVRWSFFLLLWG